MNTARRRAKGGFRSLSRLFADMAPGEMATAHHGRASARAGFDLTHFCFYEIYSIQLAFSC
jgi:hypothetical protein